MRFKFTTSVSKILNFYKLEPKDLIVIYDDIDISLGKIKIKPSGSSGTHNGMRNIISLINSEKFIRIRIGTDKPKENIDLADHVLMQLNNEETAKIEEAIKNAVEAVSVIMTKDCQSAMNLYN